LEKEKLLLSDSKSEYNVYPNPANTQVTIELNTNAINHGDYFYLYNGLGQLIEKDLLTNTISTIPISGFAIGMYYYRMVNHEQNLIKSDKLLIIH
jgi:Secretion system C-terminal sorting domain